MPCDTTVPNGCSLNIRRFSFALTDADSHFSVRAWFPSARGCTGWFLHWRYLLEAEDCCRISSMVHSPYSAKLTVLYLLPGTQRLGHWRQASLHWYIVFSPFLCFFLIIFPIGQVTVPSALSMKQLIAPFSWTSTSTAVPSKHFGNTPADMQVLMSSGFVDERSSSVISASTYGILYSLSVLSYFRATLGTVPWNRQFNISSRLS